MTITAITTGLNTQPSVYGAAAAALLAPLVYQAMDAGNGNSFVPNGRTMLHIRNTDTSSHTFAITGVADPYGAIPATGTITVPAGVLATGAGEVVMGPFPNTGPWIQPDGTVHITPISSALLFVAVVTLPG